MESVNYSSQELRSNPSIIRARFSTRLCWSTAISVGKLQYDAHCVLINCDISMQKLQFDVHSVLINCDISMQKLQYDAHSMLINCDISMQKLQYDAHSVLINCDISVQKLQYDASLCWSTVIYVCKSCNMMQVNKAWDYRGLILWKPNIFSANLLFA